MNRPEDNPPCTPPRAPRESAIRVKVASRYLVTWGLGEAERTLPTFAEALALYVENIDARGGIQIHNITRMVDGEDSGLTLDEEIALELANEMHTVEVAP